MFTGIVEAVGKIIEIRKEKSNLDLIVESNISSQLHIDQSVSHNGVCLTVTRQAGSTHEVTAVFETIRKTNLGQLRPGSLINLERCMPANGRFDGHIVQGHVDAVGKVVSVIDMNGSWQFDFEIDSSVSEVLVEKGSICVNGVSLTCFNCTDNYFSVAIIPYTYKHTCFNGLKAGDSVNLEFDIIGKYVKRLLGKN
jgi:riboflavin synthase